MTGSTRRWATRARWSVSCTRWALRGVSLVPGGCLRCRSSRRPILFAASHLARCCRAHATGARRRSPRSAPLIDGAPSRATDTATPTRTPPMAAMPKGARRPLSSVTSGLWRGRRRAPPPGQHAGRHQPPIARRLANVRATRPPSVGSVEGAHLASRAPDASPVRVPHGYPRAMCLPDPPALRAAHSGGVAHASAPARHLWRCQPAGRAPL